MEELALEHKLLLLMKELFYMGESQEKLIVQLMLGLQIHWIIRPMFIVIIMPMNILAGIMNAMKINTAVQEAANKTSLR